MAGNIYQTFRLNKEEETQNVLLLLLHFHHVSGECWESDQQVGNVLAKKLINILAIAALTRHERCVLIMAKNGFL